MTRSLQQNFWIETVWNLPKSAVEDLNLKLTQLGSLGSYEKMELTAEAEDKRVVSDVVAYFADTPDVDGLKKRLSVLEIAPVRLTAVSRIPQAEWATEWRKYFKPFFLTPDIVIRPSWEEYTPQGKEIIVTLDPGMAFGTGQHDTTRFCAELLHDIKAAYPELKSLLDVGCGSGILSIIGKKIGFTPVLGIDIDEPAIDTARENLARNLDAGDIDFHLTSGELTASFLKPHDVVVSNIIAETLCELKNDLVALVAKGGCLILSGILPEREALVKSTFADLTLEREKKSGDWHAYVYRR